MPDPSRSRKPPRLQSELHPDPSAAEREAGRELFAASLRGFPAVREKPVETSRAPRPSAFALLRALRRGQRRVAEGCEISLRGMTRERARRTLAAFLAGNRSRGVRFVKVVHGKGLQSPGGRAVLRREIPLWLGEWQRELVEIWEEARRDDGGAGALYVILRPPQT